MVVVAGGSGSRMQSDIPKQFIKLIGKPILMHTLERLMDFNHSMEIVLVLPQNQMDFWKQLCEEYNFTVQYTLASGGSTRFESVKNGLAKIKGNCLVGVHDGVRPFVSNSTLESCFSIAEKYESAVPVTDAIESIRKVSGDSSESVDRQFYKMVQTPQVFSFAKLLKAYEQPYSNQFTDDASVFESAGFKIYLSHGNLENIKVTTPMDLLIGEALMSRE